MLVLCLAAPGSSHEALRHDVPPGFAGVLLERGYLPDAKPNAFAVGFSNGVSVCFDPVRGGLNYAWSGGFVDVASIRPGMGKTVAPVALLGTIVYRETAESPWRVGRRDHVPVLQFRGYAVAGDRIEFVYTLDRIEVREQMRPREGGGLTRSFRLSGEPGPVWFVPDPRVGAVRVQGASLDAAGHRIEAGQDREFSVEVIFGGTKP